ncbi:hypothetical protein HWV62_29593 [Athelia sp. TMB]|nr:hypothetical protein HWV62_29593 [Athelia sp. TMB]
MSSARYASLSPNVALEKGAYRMRAPRRPTLETPRPVISRKPRRIWRRKHTAMLLALLLAAALASFAAAYYLFVTRWAESQIVSVTRADADPAATACADPAETFLAYLPHSGFHNQRIALENALVLAVLLNRTLLLPPARLGSKPLRYVAFDRLRVYLALSGDEGLAHCGKVPAHTYTPDECAEWGEYSHIAWDALVDLKGLRKTQGARTCPAGNFSTAWPHDSLNISESETLTLRDDGPYDFRFVDAPAPASQRYAQDIHILTLRAEEARLIQIGTLFGSARLRLTQPQNLALRTAVRRSMAFTHPGLTAATREIARTLGGEGRFLGAHVRVGDAHFAADAQANARGVWWRLVHQTLGFPMEKALELERSTMGNNTQELDPPALPVDRAALRTPHPPLPSLPKIFTPHLPCRAPLHTARQLLPLNAPLFIATDARSPATHPALEPFRATFPCAFFLGDFPGAIAQLHEQEDEGKGAMHLLPLLDALTAAQAHAVVGTRGSTFSTFVEDVLWRVGKGWDIVERG